jgi:hypothetical protein
MRQALTDGRWFDVANEQQHNNLKRCGKLAHDSMLSARVQRGKYTGPGRYLLLRYQQRCPRKLSRHSLPNCCYDGVFEVLSSQEVVDELKEQMRELAELLKKARGS